ncbi:winged helix DNA-binding domain-containing protein [bacterium (Candidatus Blackallbacteria) CG17_big_fil_post_rev_8_21_14_2_50_48_46]|uniref:Winged helix DNA-binding domain-containing protein n=1 Tax=bacterium (Candidatus Blackallbacteria) CG17_big_fil_post_rev_8_21_14_2_50_48_46 TaxID=2014261 RepID=A0A2M7G005_9BACT|nr:MAG: hypothetical protein COW64_22630 [bacterium (Candidatus Blackallbacteria) CG18_big_fil_WC_8_21_14_2_50_49_26]PIW14749.1 MAG: winged helix DNA-binding domain-containing protein [bacterium (Candidatus Blackallbacteria) CG17_big_fil_post_rev_8_21_14_2_50_48_46]PIW50851.1 MAG: winged helix DNA-binding domain-containing protein [bacterium (Candidatus Blackallbacteria) CG13_big_fil_rev_8_21_14_2_50_49_14]
MSPPEISSESIHAWRFQASGLVQPFQNLQSCARQLCGLQAQIHVAAGLAASARVKDLTLSGFDASLWQARSLVKIWGQRGTLHVYQQADWPLIQRVWNGSSWWKRRYLEAGLGKAQDYEALIQQVEKLALSSEVVGRSDLRNAGFPDSLLSSWGGIFSDLVYRGLLCHAPRAGSEGKFAHRANWLPSLPWVSPADAHARKEVIRRYLAAYGPATAQDLAHWAGWPVAQARTLLSAKSADWEAVQVAGQVQWLLRQDLDSLRQAEQADLPLMLLSRFDPLILAHKDKSWLIEPADYKKVWQKAGHVEACFLEQGKILGTWRYQRKSTRLQLNFYPFAPLKTNMKKKLENRAQEIAKFFELQQLECQFQDGV